MEPISSKDYIDVKCDELRAQSRADLAEIKSMIETKLEKLDHIPSSREFWGGILVAVLGVGGLILAVLSYTGGRSDAAGGLGAAIQHISDKADDNAQALREMQHSENSHKAIHK